MSGLAIPRPEHPRPDYMRAKWLNLNGVWKFEFCDNPTTPPLPQSLSREITVPFSWAAPLSGIGEDRKGGAWYAKEVSFSAPDGWRVFLCVGAADYHTIAYVGGAEVGRHSGGYGDFCFDITDSWNSDAANTIQLHVTDNDEIWQTRGKQGYGETRGVWQTVYLEARPVTYIKTAHLLPRLDGEVMARLEVVANKAAELPLSLNFGEGASRCLTVSVKEGEQTLEAALRIPEPIFWSTENPHIYEGTVTLGDDEVSTYFGYRHVTATTSTDRDPARILLNGVPVYLNGTLDQSFNPHGFFTLPTEDDVVMEAKRLKDLGLNFVRIHIKPEEPRKLYALSKAGIMVMEDMGCFWGEPTQQAREAWEAECREVIARDFNHPCIISWVVFNETWGLFTNIGPKQRVYMPETQEWVRAMYKLAKSLDPSRLVEDNSPCNNDHVETDLNTWHFYINGYGRVRDEVRQRVQSAVPDSGSNYIGNNLVQDVPFLNSECGMVWGVEGSAGDSDIAWQYRYMLNEFRKHDKMCGFIFTEFHDVVNEWNGYYRLNNEVKDFGYDWFDTDMTIADLHRDDFLVIDAPPCQTIGADERARIPLLYSGYNPQTQHTMLTVRWELWYESPKGRVVADRGSVLFEPHRLGTQPIAEISVRMPSEAAVAVLAARIVKDGVALCRNFITFDVRGIQTGIALSPRDGVSDFAIDRRVLLGHKRCLGGSGDIVWEVERDHLDEIDASAGLEIVFEAAARQIYKKDLRGTSVNQRVDLNYMHGYRADPGVNPNSCYMTDEVLHPSCVEVLVNDELIAAIDLPDDPADSRGVLSWHYQPSDRLLEDAGSFGYLCRARISPEMAKQLLSLNSFRVKLRVPAATTNKGGLSLYGRNAGRYPIDIMIRGLND